MNEPYVEICAVLPICLHLDKRVFTVSVGGKTVEVETHNVASEDPTWVGTAKNMEVESDDFSHFRFTSVAVKIPYTETVLDIEEMKEVMQDYAGDFFDAVNALIAACRVALKRSGLRSYHGYGQFVRPVVATVVGAINPEQHAIAAMSFGGGPLSTFRPLRTEEEHQKVQALLTDGIPLTTQFMMDAQNYLYYHDPIHALLSAVIALEIAVSTAIRRMALKKGIEVDAIKTFIHDVGLTGNIKTTLRLVVPDGTQLPDDTIFGGCKGAITVRNAIMHEGRRALDNKQVKDWLDNIDAMVLFCEALV